MKFITISFLCIAFPFCVNAQEVNDSAVFAPVVAEDTSSFVPKYLNEITISLLLPFDEAGTSARINDVPTADAPSAPIKKASAEALDFYEGFLAALNLSMPFTKVNLQVFDVGYNDSMLEEVLAKPMLANSHFIIGSGTVAGARIVAEFCKQNQIVNLQPFVISKSVSSENKFLIKLEPSIEAHIARMAKTIETYYADKKVIIYHSRMEKSMMPALLFDSLFRTYNADTDSVLPKIDYRLVPLRDAVNASDARNFSEKIDENFIVIYCGYETGFVERDLQAASAYKATAFGMPTWIDDELLRVDYINNSQLHFTNIFHPDNTLEEDTLFANNYPQTYKHQPSRASYLGYDVCRFLLYSTQLNGQYFAEKMRNIPYKGIGFTFNLEEVWHENRFLYYGNQSVYQFMVNDYRILLLE